MLQPLAAAGAALLLCLFAPPASAGGVRGREQGTELLFPIRDSALHKSMAADLRARQAAAATTDAVLMTSTWVKTTGIKWCSGGGDWTNFGSERRQGYPLGAGLDGKCPLVPASYSDAKGVAACEKLCGTDKKCLGFTWYPKGKASLYRHRHSA